MIAAPQCPATNHHALAVLALFSVLGGTWWVCVAPPPLAAQQLASSVAPASGWLGGVSAAVMYGLNSLGSGLTSAHTDPWSNQDDDDDNIYDREGEVIGRASASRRPPFRSCPTRLARRPRR